MLARWVWKRTKSLAAALGRYVALAIVVCFVSSHLIHLWAEAHFYVPVTSFTRHLPWFPLRDSRPGDSVSSSGPGAREAWPPRSRGPGSEVRYPQAPSRCEPRPPCST
jgi:hypothetical protein